MVQRLEDSCAGRGFQWAADCVRHWIEDTRPLEQEELLSLLQAAVDTGLSASNATELGEESRRIWYLYRKDVAPYRAVSNLYAALASLAQGNRNGFISLAAAAVFVAASSETFTQRVFDDLQNSFDRLDHEQDRGRIQ